MPKISIPPHVEIFISICIIGYAAEWRLILEAETLRTGRARKSELLRNKIYYRSIELFTEKGFENVKISDICKDLDISTGSFYYYFPSKESVLLEYSSASDEIMEEFSDGLQCDSCAETLVQLFCHKIRVFSVAGQKMSNVCLGAFLRHRDDSAMDMNRSAYVRFIAVLEKGKEQGEFSADVEPERIASLLRYLAGGLAMRWTCSKKDFDIDAEAETVIREFVKTITKK